MWNSRKDRIKHVDKADKLPGARGWDGRLTAKGQGESCGENGSVLYLNGSYTVRLLSKLAEVYA